MTQQISILPSYSKIIAWTHSSAQGVQQSLFSVNQSAQVKTSSGRIVSCLQLSQSETRFVLLKSKLPFDLHLRLTGDGDLDRFFTGMCLLPRLKLLLEYLLLDLAKFLL